MSPTSSATCAPPAPGMASSSVIPDVSPCSHHLGHRSDFDRSELRSRNARGKLDGVVEVARFHEVVAAELLLRFGVWPVGCALSAIACRDGARLSAVHEGLAAEQVSARLDALGVGHVLLVDALLLRGRGVLTEAFVAVDEAAVFHGTALGRMCRIPPPPFSPTGIRPAIIAASSMSFASTR